VDPSFMVASHLATVTSPEVSTFLKQMRYCKGKEGSFKDCKNDKDNRKLGFSTPDSTWIGGTIADRSCTYNSDTWKCDAVDWVNEMFSWYNYKEKFEGRSAWYDVDNMSPKMREPSLWAPGGRKVEDCIAMGSSSKSVVESYGASKWNDAQCSHRKGFFCEYCLAVRTTTTVVTSTTSGAPTSTSTVAKSTTTTIAPSTTTTTAAETSTTTAAPTTTTTTGAPTTTTTGVPTTTTTREPQCEDNTCGAQCGTPYSKIRYPKSSKIKWESKCGWSKTKGLCVEGGRTTESELKMGDCPTTPTTPSRLGVSTQRPTTTTKTKFIPPAVKCEMIPCPSDCGVQYDGSTPEGEVPEKPHKKDYPDANELEAENAKYIKEKRKLMGKVANACGWSSLDSRCKLGGMTKPSKENNKAINKLRKKYKDPTWLASPSKDICQE